MTKSDLVAYVKTAFNPLTLSLPDDVISLLISRCIQYWNVNSAHRILKMYDTSTTPITTDIDFKDVCEVYPSAAATAILMADPTWQLLGIQVMSTISSDFVALNEAYKNYLAYFGADFRWTYEPSQDPSVGGTLYLQRLPIGASAVAVVGTKRILDDEDITSEYILDWLQRAVIAQVRMFEGNILRKADIIGVKNDGSEMISEGKEEWEALRQELAVNSRWFALGKRI